MSSKTAWTLSPMVMVIIVNSKGFPLGWGGGKKNRSPGGPGKGGLSHRERPKDAVREGDRDIAHLDS